MDDTTPDRRTLKEISANTTPDLAPTFNPEITIRSEIRDDILVEDLTPRPSDPIESPPSPDCKLEQAIALLDHYSFEIEGSSARGFATYWADDLPSDWLRLAVLEALYQGRYKAISVSQILALWERKQQPQTHFNEEFERLICDRLFAEIATDSKDSKADPETQITIDPSPSESDAIEATTQPIVSLSDQAEASIQLIDLEAGNTVPADSPAAHTAEQPGVATSPSTSPSSETTSSETTSITSASPPPDSPSPDSPPPRSHPTQIAQFVPEGESHVYDKLRDLALTPNHPDLDPDPDRQK